MWEWWRKNRTMLLGLVLILAALLWYSAGLRRQEQTSLLDRSLLVIVGPVLEGLDYGISAAADIWGHYLYLVGTVEHNRQLTTENRNLRGLIARLEEIDLENRRLRRLLEFKEEQAVAGLPARIIAEDASSWFRTVMIDKGIEDGVSAGMPVVAAEGLVGRVVRSSTGQARVLLITDASSAVATLVQHNRARGVCRGQGERLSFEFVLRREDVAIGDRVVTSGMGGVFPKGLVIGQVTALSRDPFSLFLTVEVTPSVDFSHLEEVLVLSREDP
ncbi:MAG: rod shape-determining protein MreC [Desulfuromonadales bacterium]|nr:rod shape-determining protein MreC [Desulfuromonadales bacterium]